MSFHLFSSGLRARGGIGDFGVCVFRWKVCVCCGESLSALDYCRLQNCACVCVSMSLYLLCVEQLVEFDQDYDQAEAIYPADSCCCTTFDLRNAAVATLHSNTCIGTSTHTHIFTCF